MICWSEADALSYCAALLDIIIVKEKTFMLKLAYFERNKKVPNTPL